jgi:hypothetical protein
MLGEAVKVEKDKVGFTVRERVDEADMLPESFTLTPTMKIPGAAGEQTREEVSELVHPGGSPVYQYANGEVPPEVPTAKLTELS